MKQKYFHYQGCEDPLKIEDPDTPARCCYAQRDGTKCECASPQIDDPENVGECCNPDPTDNTICFVGEYYFSRFKVPKHSKNCQHHRHLGNF